MATNAPSLPVSVRPRAPRALVYAVVAIVLMSTGVMIAQLAANSSTIARLERSLAVARAQAQVSGALIPVANAGPLHSEERVALNVMRTRNRLERS